MAKTDCTRSWHWRRNLGILATVTALLLSITAPTMAITFGTPDGNAHPFVGSMVLRVPGQGVFQWCSGTLIAARVFLTA